MRASAGTGIKEPSFYETYATGFATGNRELEPEESTSFEAGIDQELGSAARLPHRIQPELPQSDPVHLLSPGAPGGPTITTWRRRAAAGSRRRRRSPPTGVRLAGSYTYLDTKVEDSGFDEGPSAAFVEGEPLLRRPRHTVGASAFVRVAAGIGVDARERRKGERSDRDFSAYPANPVTLPAYTWWTWRPASRWARTGAARELR